MVKGTSAHTFEQQVSCVNSAAVAVQQSKRKGNADEIKGPTYSGPTHKRTRHKVP